jgi:phage I-like protein
MKTIVSSLHFAIPATGEAPEWVHLIPAGTFSGVDGRGPYRIEDAGDIIQTSMAAGKLPIDENHAVDKAAPEGLPSPARGWIIAMESRASGIWGKVEWTGSGAELMRDKAYRGISPVFAHTQSGGRVVRILRAALTNDPNLTLTTLHSRSEPMDFLAKLRQALGLPVDAAEDAMLTSVSAHALAGATLGKVSAALGLAVDAKSDDIVAGATAKLADAAKLAAIAAHCKTAGLELEKLTPTELQTQLMARGGAGEEAELRKTVITLQSRLDTLVGDQAKTDATAFVDAAIGAGKPIKPLRDHYIARHQKDAAAVETEINALVSIHSGSVRPPKSSEPGALDAEDQAVVVAMGLDPKEFAKNKAALEKVAG